MGMLVVAADDEDGVESEPVDDATTDDVEAPWVTAWVVNNVVSLIAVVPLLVVTPTAVPAAVGATVVTTSVVVVAALAPTDVVAPAAIVVGATVGPTVLASAVVLAAALVVAGAALVTPLEIDVAVATMVAPAPTGVLRTAPVVLRPRADVVAALVVV
eukprot:3856514-Rhodomonas_salina.3